MDSFSGTCPYCDSEIVTSELQQHLDWCEGYENLLQTFSSPVMKSPRRGGIVCPVCFNDYNSTAHAPLVLPSCGHTVCERCLHQIVEHSTVIKCPVCRTLNFKEVESLPFNYALLDLANSKDTRELCPKHSLEIVGYCKDEESLLCGACVFEHKDHESFLLTDERSVQIAQEKKSLISMQEDKLIKLKESWQEIVYKLNNQFSNINEAAEKHVNGLKAQEKTLIEEIKEGTKACIQQVKDFVRDNEVTSLMEKVSQNIERINKVLGQLSHKQLKFEELSMVEKLKNIDTCNEETPPSVLPAENIAKLLKNTFDYRQAIYSKNLVIK